MGGVLFFLIFVKYTISNGTLSSIPIENQAEIFGPNGSLHSLVEIFPEERRHTSLEIALTEEEMKEPYALFGIKPSLTGGAPKQWPYGTDLYHKFFFCKRNNCYLIDDNPMLMEELKEKGLKASAYR